MATNFSSSIVGDLANAYVTDFSVIDQYSQTGSLWGWGYNGAGANSLGDGTNVTKSSPVQTLSSGTNWKMSAMGNGFGAGIKVDGTLWVWGGNGNGNLGDNTTVTKSSPVQTVSTGTDYFYVSASNSNMSVIKTDGTLWTWGFGGPQGDNTVNYKSSPVQTVATGNTWKLVSVNGGVAGAIKTDGTLWVWGSNSYGCLGNNNSTATYSPIQTIAGGNNWKLVSTSGNALGSAYAGAIKTDGTLWLWGNNNYGNLGNNTTTSVSSPVQTISTGTNWKQLTLAGDFCGAIKTDGTLWMWGRNDQGQLGNSSTTSTSSPIQTISTGTNWKSMAGAAPNTNAKAFGAIKTDGTLWMWGFNSTGQLGTNNTLARSSPVQTISGGANWKSLGGINFATNAIYFYDAGDLYPSR